MEKIGHFRKLIWIFLALCAALVLCAATAFHVQDMTLSNGKSYDFNTGWTLIRADGSRTSCTLPYSEKCGADTLVVLENTIPPQYAGMTLYFLSADKTLSVYVDGELIYEFGTYDERAFGKTPGSVTNFIDLPEEFDEGVIRIEMMSPYDDYAANIRSMRVAERDVAILQCLTEKLGDIVCNIVILFAAVILAVIAFVGSRTGTGTDGLEYLSVCCLLLGIYYFVETKIMNIFYGNQTVYSILIFVVLMMEPMLFVLYYEKNILKRPTTTDYVILGCSSLNITAQLILQVLNVRDFMEMAWVSHILIFVTLIVVLIRIVRTAKTQKGSFAVEFAALSCLGVGSLADLARTYLTPVADLGKFSRWGATVFCVLMVFAHGKKLTHTYVESMAENARLLKREVTQMEQQNLKLLQAKQEAEAARQQAIEANRAKSSFLANMSNEIRKPMGAVLARTEELIGKTDDASVKEYAGGIRRAGQNLLALSDDILDFSKLESGEVEIVRVQYGVSDMIDGACRAVAAQIREKKLEFHVENMPDIPSRLSGDEARIRQIAANLLTNAVKYTERGSVTLRLSYEKRGEEEISLMLEVEDTGIGIRPEDKKKLFAAFERIDERQNKDTGGLGLGLSITMRLVELMNGTVEVESEYGKGSRFTVTLPQKIVSRMPMGFYHMETV